MVLLYHVFLFTELIPDIFFQINVGYFFIVFMSGNVVVHLYFLLKTSFLDCKNKCRKRKLAKNMMKQMKVKK